MAIIRDGISHEQVKIYYLGDNNEELEKSLVSAMESNNYEFVGMRHTKHKVHLMLFVEKES